jgi:hypothetical protein
VYRTRCRTGWGWVQAEAFCYRIIKWVVEDGKVVDIVKSSYAHRYGTAEFKWPDPVEDVQVVSVRCGEYRPHMETIPGLNPGVILWHP